MKRLAIRVLKATHLFTAVERTTRPVRTWRKEQQWRRLYSHFLKPGDLCFDIGANVGERTKLLVSLGARIVAVEPQTACYRQLSERFAGNPNIVVLQQAVSDHAGVAKLALSATSTELATLAEHWTQEGPYSESGWTGSEEVQTTTLDKLIETYGVPTFTKIDVEGHERSVLAGLSQPLPALSFEFTRQYLDHAEACMTQIESLGPTEFNVNFWPGPPRLERQEWLDRAALLKFIAAAPSDLWSGDVYARTAPRKALKPMS